MEHMEGALKAGKQYWKKLTPSVKGYWLLLLSGLLWSIVGIALCITATQWLAESVWPYSLVAAIIGFALGKAIHQYGFSRIARKNIQRIIELQGRVCLFAFQTWRSYLLIVTMMSIGLVLRHCSAPKLILSIIYLTIGTALTFSSILYYEKII
jgi:hypothetical protein